MNNKLIQKFRKTSRQLLKRLIPQRKPPRLEGKAQNVGIKPVQKKKKD